MGDEHTKENTSSDNLKIITKRLNPKERPPFLVETFVSLEGEGGNNSIGIPTLFVRLGVCNCSCNFCDTAFSIKGHEKYNLCRADTELTDYITKNIDSKYAKNIHAVSITGGEPLLHIESLTKICEQIKNVFTKTDMIIMETNGTLLSVEDNAIALFKQIKKIKKMGISFTISMSPKLNGKVAYRSKSNNNDILEMYKHSLNNYHVFLEDVCDLQVKFVHSNELKLENEPLIQHIIEKKYIRQEQILVMALTPSNYLKNPQDWKKAQDLAANYALENNLRYSPRIHIDRGLP